MKCRRPVLTQSDHALIAQKMNFALVHAAEVMGKLASAGNRYHKAIESHGHMIHWMTVCKAHMDSICAESFSQEVSCYDSPYYPQTDLQLVMQEENGDQGENNPGQDQKVFKGFTPKILG